MGEFLNNSYEPHIHPLRFNHKKRLKEAKSSDETWDEFLLRIVSESGSGMTPGTLDDDEADQVHRVIGKGRDR